MRIRLHEGLLVLARQVGVVVLLLGVQSGPPLSENLGDGAVLQVRVLLADHRAVALAEDEKGVHRPLLRLLTGHGARVGGGGRRQ